MGAFFDYAINERLEAYSELALTRNEAAQNLAPIPTGSLYLINLDNPLLSDDLRQLAAEQFIPVGPNLVGFGLRRR